MKDAHCLILSCAETNDLFRVLGENRVESTRYDTPAEAVRQAPSGAGVMLLADGYPERPTLVTPELLDDARAKNLRLYLEFPSMLPGMDVAAPRAIKRERAVVLTDAFGASARPMSILTVNDCRFVPVTYAHPHLALAEVAGFDQAVFGLADTTAWPLLFEHTPGLLVATGKLSQFVTARYGPQEGWQAVWQMIFDWLVPDRSPVTLGWTATVRPRFGREDPLPAGAARQAIIAGLDWHTHARLFVHAQWKERADNPANPNRPIAPPPEAGLPVGDGEWGLLEGFASKINWDGSQDLRWWLRSDCNGESALPFALRWRLDGDERSRRIAGNLADWVWFKSGLFNGGNPESPRYGLLGMATTGVREAFFGDNDVKALLGTIGAAALLETERWNECLVANILANFRTTGTKGFRHSDFRVKDFPPHWRTLFTEEIENPHPHFQAWIWALYLWLYDKTGYQPLLERTRTAIRITMEAYPDRWRWTNGLQQERGRMLLPLAWLIRVQDTPEHRAWLRRIAADLHAAQQPCGAFIEEIGDPARGEMPPPTANRKTKHAEAPLIMKNGDPVTDLLYTDNFAFFGLHEAYAATGEDLYRDMADRLAEFLLRVQIRSEAHPELDGAWYRAFDFRRWEYFASNADIDWGPWCTEVGWTEGWIPAVLSLRELRLNLWDLSSAAEVKTIFDRLRPSLLGDEHGP